MPREPAFADKRRQDAGSAVSIERAKDRMSEASVRRRGVGTPEPKPQAHLYLAALQDDCSMPEPDHVTGLATRSELHRVLEAEQGVVAVVICDVVGLKAVNERDGFLAGDAMLRQAAERLRQASVDAALVARLGGDELVAIFGGGQAVADAEAVAAVVAGPGAPGMRAAAVAAIAAEPAGSLIERAYAAMRRS